MSYLVTDPRANQRQIGAWVDRQTHDEFEVIAKAQGISKAKLLGHIIEQYVAQIVKREAA